jgi:hypothetical protein
MQEVADADGCLNFKHWAARLAWHDRYAAQPPLTRLLVSMLGTEQAIEH